MSRSLPKKPRRTTELPNGAPKSSLSGNAVALDSDSEGEYDDYWDVEENLTLKEAVLTTCLEAGYFFHALGDRKSTRLNSSHVSQSRMPSSA